MMGRIRFLSEWRVSCKKRCRVEMRAARCHFQDDGVMSRELLRFYLRELAVGRTNCQGVERTVCYLPASVNDRYCSLCLYQIP
jgi:hypothetical protein